MKPVKTGYRAGDKVALDEGLAGGEQVAIEGLQKIYPGAKLKPVPEGAQPAPAAAATTGAGDQHGGKQGGVKTGGQG